MRLRTHFNTEFFYLLFGCHTVDFGPLFRGEASLFNDVNHIYLLRPEIEQSNAGGNEIELNIVA